MARKLVGRGPRLYKANSRYTWAAGWNTSMSKACAIVVNRMYTGEALLGHYAVQMNLGRVVSLWTPNKALSLLYIPLSMPRTLIVCPWRGRGSKETCEPEGAGSKVLQSQEPPCHVWAAHWDTGISEAYAMVVKHAYIEGSLPESFHNLTKPGHGL